MRKLSIVFACLCIICCFSCHSNSEKSSIIENIEESEPLVVLQDGSISSEIKVARKWDGSNCQLTIILYATGGAAERG